MNVDRTHADTIRKGLSDLCDAASSHIINNELPMAPVNAAYSEALAALDGLLADLAAATERAEQAEKWFVHPDDFGEMQERACEAEAQLAAAREALTAIADNAEDWHGPPPDMGHVRALKVIATWARAALAASE